MNHLFSNLRYWLGVDHLAQVRRHGLRNHLRYVFNFNVDRVVVNLQRDLDDLPPLEVPEGLTFRPADLRDAADRAHWIRLVNAAYFDATEDDRSAERLLSTHAFLTDMEVFFLCRDDRPIATVSTGVFRNAPTFGGDARIAVDPAEQGQGLGRTLILFALHRLRSKGLTHAEAVITLKREQSLRLHFKLDFQIPPHRRQWNFDIQRRMWPVRWLVHSRLRRIQRGCIAPTHGQSSTPV